MDLFSLFSPAGNDSYFMRMASVNQMSQMMHGLSVNPLNNMGTMDPMGPRVNVSEFRHLVSSTPWVDLFPPSLGSCFQSMNMLGGDPNMHSYCSSTMMSMTTGPDGRPVVYQASSSSTRAGPGGVCEIQKSVCDNVTGTKKLQIGRHIGNRGHVVEREQNFLSGEKEEREDFINIEEDEAEKFTEEFQWRARRNRMPSTSNNSWDNPNTSGQQNVRGTMLALPSSRTSTRDDNSVNGWVETPQRATWHTNHYGNTESPRIPNRGRKNVGRSSVDANSFRNRNRPRKGFGRCSGDSRPYSCEKIRKRDHCHDEVGYPLSSKTKKTSPPDVHIIE